MSAYFIFSGKECMVLTHRTLYITFQYRICICFLKIHLFTERNILLGCGKTDICNCFMLKEGKQHYCTVSKIATKKKKSIYKSDLGVYSSTSRLKHYCKNSKAFKQ